MSDKELRKLKRIELYRIMLAQSEEIDRLKGQVEELQGALASKELTIQQAGSLAEASLRVTKIFEEAQKAADVYLYNIKKDKGAVDEQS